MFGQGGQCARDPSGPASYPLFQYGLVGGGFGGGGLEHHVGEAIAEDNPHATINHYPAMVKIDAPGRLTVKRASVEEKLGRDWDPQEIQINLISISGNVVESEEEFAVERLS